MLDAFLWLKCWTWFTFFHKLIVTTESISLKSSTITSEAKKQLLGFRSLVEPEFREDSQGHLLQVERVEVKTRSPCLLKLSAQLGSELNSNLSHCLLVVLDILDGFEKIRRDTASAKFGHPGEAAIVLNAHDAGDDRDGDPVATAGLNKRAVHIRVEDHLRYDDVRP